MLVAAMLLSLVPASLATGTAEISVTDVTLLYDMCKLDGIPASDNPLTEITYAVIIIYA